MTKSRVPTWAIAAFFLAAAALLSLVRPAPAQPVQPIPVSATWLSQGRIASISVTTSSAATALPTNGFIAWICNTGSNDAFLAFGNANTIAATVAGSSWLKANTCASYLRNPLPGSIYTYVAAIGNGGVTTLYVETGLGDPPQALNSAGGGGAGSATAANQALQLAQETLVNTNIGPLGATVCASDTGSCSLNALIQRMLQRQTSTIALLPASIGQKTAAGSLAVVLASDQALPLPSGAATETTLAAINTKTPSLGQGTVATSSPVVLPSDPDGRPNSGTVTVQDTGSSTTTGQSSASIVTGTPTASSFQSQAINGQSTSRIMVSGTWTGTLTLEGSIDSGTTWVAIPARITGTSYTLSSVTGNGMFDSDVSGLTNVRMRATAAMTGTATVRFTFSSVGGPVQVLNPVRLFDNTTGYQAGINANGAVKVTPLLTSRVCVTPTVTNNTYAVNQSVGGLLTFANLFTSPSFSGTIQSVSINFTTAQTVAMTLYPFAGSPTNASTWTDRTTAAISGFADIFLTGPPIVLSNPNSGLGTMTNYSVTGLGQAYSTGATSGYFILVPNATTASLGGTTNVVSVCLTMLQDN